MLLSFPSYMIYEHANAQIKEIDIMYDYKFIIQIK